MMPVWRVSPIYRSDKLRTMIVMLRMVVILTLILTAVVDLTDWVIKPNNIL